MGLHTRVVAGLALGLVSGCGPQATEAELQQPAVTINALALTPAELKQERDASGWLGAAGASSAGAEPEWLTRVIERELLVQEAQRLGLDREPRFMRAIERFWKEALIKSLIDRKGREIASQTHVYEPELEAAYQRLSEEIRVRIVSVADEATASRLTQAQDLERELDAGGEALLDDSGWQWYTGGMLEPALETVVYDTPPGQRSAPRASQGRWTLVAVAERRGRAIEPLAEMREELVRAVRQRKEAHALEEWLAALRAQARIEIDEHVIEALP